MSRSGDTRHSTEKHASDWQSTFRDNSRQSDCGSQKHFVRISRNIQANTPQIELHVLISRIFFVFCDVTGIEATRLGSSIYHNEWVRKEKIRDFIFVSSNFRESIFVQSIPPTSSLSLWREGIRRSRHLLSRPTIIRFELFCSLRRSGLLSIQSSTWC